MKRFFALIVSCSVVLSMLVPFAYASDISSQPVTYWDRFLYYMINPFDDSGLEFEPINIDIQSIRGQIYSILSSNLCTNSPDNLHYVHHFLGESGDDWHGHFQLASCKYCGHDFKVYGDDIEECYNDYVSDNNLNNGCEYGPDGGLYWYPTLNDISGSAFTFNSSSDYFIVYTFTSNCSQDLKILGGDFDGTANCYVISPRSGKCTILAYTKFVNRTVDSSITFHAPVSGSYYLSDDSMFDFGGKYKFTSTRLSKNEQFYAYNTISKSLTILANGSFTFTFYLPSFKIIPDVSVYTPVIPTTIKINNNDYGVKSFDFSTRTYHLTNYSGDDITVKYDNDNYTMTNNTTNTTNTYNYYITNNTTNNNGSGDSGGGSGIDYTNILTQIKDLCTQILNKIGSGVTGTPVLPEDVTAPEVTEKNDSISFLTTFLSKFGFITQVYNIVAQMARDVTNDAVSAQAVSDGIIPMGALSSAHAPADSGSENTGQDINPDDDEELCTETVEGETISTHATFSGMATAPEVLTRLGSNDLIDLSEYSAIDLSWYAPYKSGVDSLLSGFLWLGYIWLLFKRLPSIIRGGQMASDDMKQVDAEIWKKIYE